MTVEAIGDVHLKHGDNTYNGAPQYYIVDGSNAPIGLTNGGPKGPTSYAGWSATQVEKNGDHYEVLWTHPTGKDMKSGRLMHQATSSQVLKLSYGKMKKSLSLDLNGDGDTGLVTVEAIGDVHLKHGDNTSMVPHNTTSLTAVMPLLV